MEYNGHMDQQSYYLSQKMPPLAPPSWIFGVVWSFLYLLIIISYGMVFYKWSRGEIAFVFALPFIVNLVANLVFTYLQFGLKNNVLALIDILIILITIIVTIVLLWPHFRTLAYMQIPYLIWVAFATYLQIGITILNR
jgi:tryptophan-rich sensory protein